MDACCCLATSSCLVPSCPYAFAAAAHLTSVCTCCCYAPQCVHLLLPNRYVILPKDFEKGYKANVKKSDTEFAFYQ